MTSRQTLRLFGISLGYLARKQEMSRWQSVLSFFDGVSHEDAIRELEAVVRHAGPDKPPLYYMEGVRRRLLDKQHFSTKKAPVVPSIREIMRNAGNAQS